MTNKENLISDIINESQLETYGGGNQRVGFYDGVKAGEPVLYLYLKSLNDRNTVLRRKAGERFINGQSVCETKLFARAYDKYLTLKSSKGAVASKEVELEAKVKELEAKVKVSPKAEEVKSPKSPKAKESKEELATPVVSLSSKSKVN